MTPHHRTPSVRFTGGVALFGLVLLVSSGCESPPKRLPQTPLSMAEAAAIANANIARIGGTLRAVGAVDGQVRSPGGRRRSYHVDGVLFYHRPSFVRFELKALGHRQFLFGANLEEYWVYSKEEGRFHCGRYDDVEDPEFTVDIRPDNLADALGLTPIPTPFYVGSQDDPSSVSADGPGREPTTCIQRVVDDYQQILFVVYDQQGHPTLEKEYWLDRCAPRLIRQVIFRDGDGVVTMTSKLDDYRPLPDGGPALPHLMTADWPQTAGRMRFQVRQWAIVPTVGPGGIQFAPPKPCRGPGLPDNFRR